MTACGGDSGGTSSGPRTVAKLPASATPEQKAAVATSLQARLTTFGLPATVVAEGDSLVLTPTAGLAPDDDDLAILLSVGDLQLRPVLRVYDAEAASGVVDGDACLSTFAFNPASETAVLPQCSDGTLLGAFEAGPAYLGRAQMTAAGATTGSNGQPVARVVLVEGPGGLGAFNELAAVCLERGPSCPTGQIVLALDGRAIASPTLSSAAFERPQIEINLIQSIPDMRRIAAALSTQPLPVAPV